MKAGVMKNVDQSCFSHRDMAPEGSTLDESNRNLDEITDLALELQNQTGVKVLWVTCNLFAHPRSVWHTERSLNRRRKGRTLQAELCHV